MLIGTWYHLVAINFIQIIGAVFLLLSLPHSFSFTLILSGKNFYHIPNSFIKHKIVVVFFVAVTATVPNMWCAIKTDIRVNKFLDFSKLPNNHSPIAPNGVFISTVVIKFYHVHKRRLDLISTINSDRFSFQIFSPPFQYKNKIETTATTTVALADLIDEKTKHNNFCI